MSVNLSKNKDSLVKSWEEIRNPSGKNDWVIFGYEGTSSDLKVVSQGEDGIEEMVDDLNGGKIQYVGLRVIDPNSSLPKIVFINWQGEGVPANVKGKCANHLQDITNLFRGFHVQINARSEDDVEESIIMEKVRNASGAKFGVHKEKPVAFIPQGKIGTQYERIRPDLDVGIKEKDKFWQENFKEEQKRKEAIARQYEEERITESRKRAEREKKETDVRNKMILERSKSIDEQRKNSELIELKKRQAEEEKRKYHEVLAEAKKDDDEFRKRADSDRRRRIQEASVLIRQRQESFGETSPRDVFEKPPISAPPPKVAPKKKKPPLVPQKMVDQSVSNVTNAASKSQFETEDDVFISESKPPKSQEVPISSVAPVLMTPPESNSLPEPEPAKVPESETVHITDSEMGHEVGTEIVPTSEPEPVTESHDRNPEPVIAKELPPEPSETAFHHKELPSEPLHKQLPPEPIHKDLTPEPVHKELPPEPIQRELPPEPIQRELPPEPIQRELPPEPIQKELPPEPAEAVSTGKTLTARALYDYEAVDGNEITFDPGDIITNIQMIDEGWWHGLGPSGNYGMFPSNYVELIDSDDSATAVEEAVQPVPIANDTGICAKAVYDYQAIDDTEISFDPGDLITNIDQIDEGWWRGNGPDGRNGLFPANYVELIS